MTLLKENKLAAASVAAVIAGLIAFYVAFWGTTPETAVTAPAAVVPAPAAADTTVAPATPEASGAPTTPQAPATPGEVIGGPVPPTNENESVSH